MTSVVLPPPPARVHFIGIGGIGMSGLAAVLHGQGYTVTGSDSGVNPQTAALGEAGVRIVRGHDDPSFAAAADLVVITAAVSDNPEIRAAREAGVEIVKRAQLLGELTAIKQVIAVAGSHGKSTTSGMIVTALDALGDDPSYFVGAVVGSTGSNAAWTDGPYVVVEADEYDRSFLTLHPDVAIVTNVEFDHPDLFTQASYDEAFADFLRRIRSGGVLVVRGDDPGVARLRSTIERLDVRTVTFGEADDCDWRIDQRDARWRVSGPEGIAREMVLEVPGKHNVLDAVAALAALVELGFEPDEIVGALSRFRGVGRRFEYVGEAAGVTVVDDYAHHPTEVRATLDAARDRFPGRRIWAIFQPHTYSRTRALLPEFAESLARADEVVLLDIYAARETDDGRVSSADLAALIAGQVLVLSGVPEVVPAVYPLLRAGDVVLTIGAGDVTQAAPLLVRALERGSID